MYVEWSGVCVVERRSDDLLGFSICKVCAYGDGGRMEAREVLAVLLNEERVRT